MWVCTAQAHTRTSGERRPAGLRPPFHLARRLLADDGALSRCVFWTRNLRAPGNRQGHILGDNLFRSLMVPPPFSHLIVLFSILFFFQIFIHYAPNDKADIFPRTVWFFFPAKEKNFRPLIFDNCLEKKMDAIVMRTPTTDSSTKKTSFFCSSIMPEQTAWFFFFLFFVGRRKNSVRVMIITSPEKKTGASASAF